MNNFKKAFYSILFLFSISSAFAQTNNLNISTSTGWVPLGAFTTTTTSFYGHSNWMSINSAASNTSYKFKRTLYVCAPGIYKLSFVGMADNQLKVTLNGSTVFSHAEITTSAGFNTPTKGEKTVQLKCGIQTLEATVFNRTSISGFFLSASITSPIKSLSETPCRECCDCTKPTDARATVNISYGPGGVTLSATGMPSVSGLGQGWVLKKVSCPGPIPCGWVAGGITAQGIGGSFAVPAGVLTPGSCYILTHYVNVCSPKWNPQLCRVAKTICFTVSGNTMMAKPTNPNAKVASQMQTIPVDEIPAKETSSEMDAESEGIK